MPHQSHTHRRGGATALTQTVQPGDVLELYLSPAAGVGDFVGVQMAVNFLSF